MYIKHLLIMYASCASQVDQRSNEVTEVKRSNSSKTLLLLHNKCYGHVTQVREASTRLI